MKTILIITSSLDYTVDYLILKFGHKFRFLRLNVDMLYSYRIDITERTWQISTSYWCVNKDEILSIYYRKPRLPDLSSFESRYHFMIQRDILATITGLVDSFDGLVLSKPSILRQTENKIYQIQKCREIGFITPNTLITNNTNRANTFIRKMETVIKPITTGKVHFQNKFEIFQTKLVNKMLGQICITPVYLQEYKHKLYEVRLTIIAGSFYGVKIQSTNKVDWRDERAVNTYAVIDVPEDIKKMCSHMLDILGLEFGAFDFIVDDDNHWIFLEVNPNGQWLWLEEKLNLNISEKIMNFLSGEKDEINKDY